MRLNEIMAHSIKKEKGCGFINPNNEKGLREICERLIGLD